MSVYLNLALDGEMGSSTRQVLDGVEYRVIVRWLAYEPIVEFHVPPEPPPLTISGYGAWSLALAQQDGTLLVSGQLLRTGADVLRGFRGDVRFPGRGFGRLLAWDTSGRGRNPGRDDLDTSSVVRLAYVPASEA